MKAKKIFLLCLLFVGSCTTCMAQSSSNTKGTQPSPDQNVDFRLYQTNNMWTFLKLDTRNGKITHVQFSLELNKQLEYELNNKSLVGSANEEKPGRFFLYPTENTYNFILLDQIDGRVWQVQWSSEEKNRRILRIN